MKRTSVACRTVADAHGNRVSGCGAGWWADTLGVRSELLLGPTATLAKCPRCGGPLHVTGTVAVVVVELRSTCTICTAVLADPTDDERMSGLCMRCLWGDP